MASVPAAPPSRPRQGSSLAASRAAPILLGWLFVLSRALAPVRETDAGWHLAVGRVIARHGIPFENALSWTHPHAPWFATSWLFDWLAYETTLRAGVLGLQLFTFLWVAATIAVAAEAAHRLHPFGAWVAPTLALLLAYRITPRPEIASQAVLAAVLLLGLRGTRPARMAAVALIALGSNLHTGVVFAAALLGLFCLEAGWRERRQRRSAAVELAIAASGVLGVVANPGGLFDARYLVLHLHVQSVVRLAEFFTPTLVQAPTFYALLALALAAGWRVRRERPALFAAAVVFGALGIYALRLVYEFEVVGAVTVVAGLSTRRMAGRSRVVGLSLAALFGLALAARMGVYDDLRLGARFDQHALPVRAARYIRSRGLRGRFFNAFRDGGYLEWKLPRLPAFQDARIQAYPPSFFAREESAEKSPAAFRAYARDLGVEWAVASRTRERLAGFRLFDGPGWALVYWDDATEVWVRRDVPRWARLVARDQYRCVVPYGSVVGRLRSLDRRALGTCVSEADRVTATGTVDPQVAIVRCGALVRLGAPEATAACHWAAALSDTGRERALLAMARALPLAGP